MGQIQQMDTIIIPGYSQLKPLGKGGMASVYLATQQSVNRQVAIKVLLPQYSADHEFCERFLREAKIVAGLSHTNIVNVYDFGHVDKTLYMVMELLSGGDLSKKIQSKHLKESEILSTISNIASALDYAHKKGFIHRDVKPENILFREDGGCVLTDFGIARKQDSNTQLTQMGMIVGTPKYMSPEQLRGAHLDGRSDIYSLGIMFYEMLTQHAPYEDADFMRLAAKHINAPIPKLPNNLSRYQKIIERFLAKEPEKRFQSGQEIVDFLEQVKSGRTSVDKIKGGRAEDLQRIARATLSNEKKINDDFLSFKKLKLPRNQMIFLQELDPLYNDDWYLGVQKINETLSIEDQKILSESYLQPKGIIFDSAVKQFVFIGRASVYDVMNGILKDAELRKIAAKVLKAEEILNVTDDPFTFSDMLEATLAVIDSYDVGDSLSVKKEKQLLRASFLDDVVKVLKEAHLNTPENKRFLTAEVIKSYMIHVYIKQQALGYRFRTLSKASLKTFPHEFIQEYVLTEFNLRQLDAVRVKQYLFLIGPTKSSSQNAFSIRRFLQEDMLANGSIVYFNGVALYLNKLNEPKAITAFKWVISRIVTLERQISKEVYEAMRHMEVSYQEHVLPSLFREPKADGTDVNVFLNKMLNDFESSLNVFVFSKISNVIVKLAKTNDDYEFLFLSLRRFLIEVACDIRDFSAHSFAVMSDAPVILEAKVLGYLRLLEKRKSALFTGDRDEGVNADIDDFKASLLHSIAHYKVQLSELDIKLKALIDFNEKKKNFLFVWWDNVSGNNKKRPTMHGLEQQVALTKKKALVDIIKLFKKFSAVSIYLEYEDLLPIDVNKRHYIIPVGDLGISKMPTIFVLYEDSQRIDLDALEKLLNKRK